MKITCIAGLPGSGKTTLGTNLVKHNYAALLLDNFATSSEKWRILEEHLAGGLDIVLADNNFCLENFRNAFKETVLKTNPSHEISFIYFENNLPKCAANLQRSGAMDINYAALGELACRYTIPLEAKPLQINTGQIRRYECARNEVDLVNFFSCLNIDEMPRALTADDISGKEISTDDMTAIGISNYCAKKFKGTGKLKTLDIGCGNGNLVRAMKRNFEAYGMDINPDVVSLERSSVIEGDATLNIPSNLFNAFDFTTSFEVFEHIKRKDEDRFLWSLKKLSRYHLCSIHINDWPGTSKEHCNIKHTCCWLELFRKHGISYEILGRPVSSAINGNHVDDYGAYGGSLPYSTSEEFRYEVFPPTNIFENWRHSMIVLLDFTPNVNNG